MSRGRSGRVILVGAGPGDPGLLTLRGAEALRAADVVVYDALAEAALLDLAAPGAERIAVGKRGHDAPTRDQDEINALLVEKARAGHTVVRLKGGDPFVFGRGGEEASACAAAGIPCEVVPGVPSAIAAPATAGIPVTDRRHAASFAVVTGHKDPTRVSQRIDWVALARAVDTLVVLMGMRSLEGIVGELLKARGPDTPSAAVMWGTTPRQRVVEARLGDLVARVREARLAAPTAIIIGDVVRLRETLAWRKERPLAGRRVLVTRSEEQSGPLVEALERAGAEPVPIPLLHFEAPDATPELDAALAELAAYDVLLLTSQNAVRYLAARAEALGTPLSDFRGLVVCVGPATERAARAAGLRADRAPAARYDAEGLLEELPRWITPNGKRFLLPRAEDARETLPEGLRAQGARVDAVTAYRNRPPAPDSELGETLRRRLVRGELDVLTFTSPSSVRHFSGLLDAESREAVGACTRVAIGPVTAEALRAEGWEPDVMPERAGADELVEALVRHEGAGREETEGEA